MIPGHRGLSVPRDSRTGESTVLTTLTLDEVSSRGLPNSIHLWLRVKEHARCENILLNDSRIQRVQPVFCPSDTLQLVFLCDFFTWVLKVQNHPCRADSLFLLLLPESRSSHRSRQAESERTEFKRE